MKKFALALGTTLVVSGALAQTSFPDVPEDNFAAAAVAELVELGILTGFPDGTFRGNEAFTRYQAALVVSRLLDVLEENAAAAGALSEEDLATINNVIQELSSGLGSLDERVAALETAETGVSDELAAEVAALGERLGALEERGPDTQLAEEFVALESRVAALEAAGAEAPAVDVAALQEQITALNAQVNELQTQLEVAQVVPEAEVDVADVTPEEPAVDLTPPAVAAPEAVAVTGARSGPYFGFAALNELGARLPVGEPGDDAAQATETVYRVRPRFKLGIDDIVAGFGLRAAADYGRQSLIENGSVALSGHLTYGFGVPAVGAYVGLGGGYQFSGIAIADTALTSSAALEGPFAGALLGAEFGSGPITFFVEGTADYYFGTVAAPNGQVDAAQLVDIGTDVFNIDGILYDSIYPTVAVGLNIRP